MEDAKLIFQRYVDADLEQVTAVVELEESYGSPSYAWAWALGGLVLLGIAGFAIRKATAKSTETATHGFRLPAEINSFTVVALLRELRDARAVPQAQTAELDSTIAQIERELFREEASEGLDLRSIAECWLRRVA